MEKPEQQEHGFRPVGYSCLQKRAGGRFQGAQAVGNNGDNNRSCMAWACAAVICLVVFLSFFALFCLLLTPLCVQTPLVLRRLSTKLIDDKLRHRFVSSKEDFCLQLPRRGHGQASVVYRKQRLWDTYIDAFYVKGYKEKKIHVNFFAPSSPQWVASDVAAEKTGNGISSRFGLYLEAIGRMDGRKGVLETSCGHLKLVFSSNSAAAQLTSGPKKCKTEFDNQ